MLCFSTFWHHSLKYCQKPETTYTKAKILARKNSWVDCTAADKVARCRFMDRRGACCISQNTGSGAHDLSKFDKIMLRFRPIAPKPVVGNPTSDGALSDNREICTSIGRTKRRCLRDNSYYHSSKKHNKIKNNEKCFRRREASTKETVVTLPLLPEASFRKDNLPVTTDLSARNGWNVLEWLSFENYDGVKLDPTPTDNGFGLKMEQAGVMMQLPPCFAGSLVTVECVTGTSLDGEGLGTTDEERRANLSKDTCPSFISDRLGSVTWTNGSYRKLVSLSNSVVDNVQVTEATRVWLVTKEKKVEMAMRSLSSYPGFTCRVKLQYSCGAERKSLTVPCDVWRTNDGGFAWRLDVEAGLSLSLGR